MCMQACAEMHDMVPTQKQCEWHMARGTQGIKFDPIDLGTRLPTLSHMPSRRGQQLSILLEHPTLLALVDCEVKSDGREPSGPSNGRIQRSQGRYTIPTATTTFKPARVELK